jgi:plastocyanin
MVQILTLVGAAALLAQTAFGAAVPVKRTSHNSNNYNQQQESNNQYESGNQDSNQYGGNSYNQQYNQDSYQNGNAYEVTTTALAQMVHETTTAMMHDTTTVAAEMVHETTTMMMHETSTAEAASTETSMAHETTTTEMAHETSSVEAQETSTAEYTMPTYGSGSSSWNNNGYNNCVSQCMAQFGAPPSTMTGNEEALPSATGTGAVHTILVAPTGAGLRYMPFAVNATVGDTIRYVWTTPANHTATLSSALAICNKSGIAESRNFVSGVKNAADGNQQVFDVTVETDQPQFFYCSVAQHCAKGMFGIINPGNNQDGANVGSMMSSMMQENPGLQAAYMYAQQNISTSTAKNWGMAMSLDGIPESAYADVAANVLFTQATFAANEGMLETGRGATTPDGSPVMVPDLNVLLSNTNGAAPTTPGAEFSASVSAPLAAATSDSVTPLNAYGNGASKSSAGVWVAAVVGIAGWLLI